jgi:hypothetical protein
MLWWMMNSSANALRISHTLKMRQTFAGQGPSIQSRLPKNYPVEFARTPDGYIYMASGLSGVTKWDGLSLQSSISGIIAPSTAVSLSFSGSGGSISGRYQAYVRFLDRDGNVSNLSPLSSIVSARSATTVNYTNVAVSTEPHVTKRQILRNTDGQFLTFYVDVETSNLFQTSFTSTRTDGNLQLQEPVPLFDQDLSQNISNYHSPPPDDKPFISFYQNRLFGYGQVDYSEGNAQVTNGSATVTIIGGDLTSSMADRLLYIDGADVYYTIDSVDTTAGTLTLSESYRGETNKWAAYTITPDPDRRHLLCYSEAGQFDSWRTNQNIVVASSDDIDDEPTGLVSTQSFLFVLQRRHIYRLTYLEDPILDGGIFLSARRGCVNNRCWVTVDGFIYLLDDRGVYRFDGSDSVEDISPPIQDLFYFDRPEGERRINWDASRFFHASHDRNDSTIRWFVAFSGSRYPRHALCFNYITPQWWIEEYPWPLGDSTLLKSANPIPIVASAAHRVFALGVGTLDHLSSDAGATLVQADFGGIRSVTIRTSYSMPASLVGVPIAVTSGRGKHQTRIITNVSGQQLFVDRPWSEKPDSTSWCKLGGIGYKWKSHWIRWAPSEVQLTRRITSSFRPVGSTTMDLRVYEDYSEDPADWALSWPVNANEGSGVSTEKGSPDAVFDLSLPRGFAYLQMDDMKEGSVWKKEMLSAEIRGFSGSGTIRIYSIDVEGAIPQ